MKKEKISANELSQVTGGSETDSDLIECPNCHVKTAKLYALYDRKVDGCDEIDYYRCPYCKHEWEE